MLSAQPVAGQRRVDVELVFLADAARSIGRIVIMGGSIDMRYDGRTTPEPEWNVRTDLAAARKVLTSGAVLTGPSRSAPSTGMPMACKI